MMTAVEIKVKTLLESIEEANDYLRSAFGPIGKAVMIVQKSPKEITVTKTGVEILACFTSSEDPLLRLTSKAIIETIDTALGDGAKIVLSLISAFLRALQREFKNKVDESQVRNQVLKQLSWLRSSFLPDLETYIRSKSMKRSSLTRDKKLLIVCETFYRTRVSSTAGKTLKQLTFETYKYLKEKKNSSLTKAFETKCIEVFNESVTSSRVESGFLLRLNKDLPQLSSHKLKNLTEPENIRFLIWQQHSSKQSVDLGIEPGNNVDLKTFVCWRHEKAKLFFSFLYHHKVAMVLCTFGLPEYARFALTELDYAFVVVEHCNQDELHDLALEADILIWTGGFEMTQHELNSRFSPDIHVGQISSPLDKWGSAVSKCFVGQDIYLRLSIPSQQYTIICAPTRNAAKQLSMSVRHCLQVMALVDDENEDHSPVIDAKSAFDLIYEAMGKMKPCDQTCEIAFVAQVAFKEVQSIVQLSTEKNEAGQEALLPLSLIMRQIDGALGLLQQILSIERTIKVSKINEKIYF